MIFECGGEWVVFLYDDVGGVSKPSAGIGKGLVQSIHHEVDGAAMCVAGEASVGVATGVECQTGVVVVVEGA